MQIIGSVVTLITMLIGYLPLSAGSTAMDRTARRRDIMAAIGSLTVGSQLAGCASPTANDGDGDGDDASTTVEMTDGFVFDPDELSISVGETVVWENVGSVEHSVTAYADRIPDGAEYFASGGFDSEQAAKDAYPDGAIDSGESFSHTFQTAGSFEYFCIPHESTGMKGRIEVG